MTEEDLKVKVLELENSNAAMVAKNSELLGELKGFKSKYNELKDTSLNATPPANDGELTKLQEQLKSSEMERNSLKEGLSGLKLKVSKQAVNQTAIKIAATLAEGSNVELLGDYIARRLSYGDDDKVTVLDDSGAATISTVDQLAEEFKSNDKFKSLLKSSKSIGGGASGGNQSAGGSAPGNKTLTRENFRKLNAIERGEFMKSGGKLTTEE